MTLEADIDRVTMQLERPFTIARGTTEETDVHVVTLTDADGETGTGASAPARYLGETPETVEAVLPELCEVVTAAPDPLATTAIERRLAATVPHNPAARTAVSIALHDLIARRFDVPLCRSLGIPADVPIESSFTIGIDDAAAMAEHAAEAVATGHNILKLKLGTDRDEEVLSTVRDIAPDARIRVDANEGWTPARARDVIDVCASHDVELVEQPVPAADLRGLGRVYDRSPLPIIADEACSRAADVPRVAGRCDVVNLKLMKCGGIREAIRVIHVAKAHQLEVMLGCMVESAVSIAAAAHLAPLVEYADLDGALLVKDDPYTGSPVTPGSIDLDVDRPGLAVSRA